MSTDGGESTRVRRLRRVLRIVMPFVGLLTLAVLVTISAMPWLSIALGVLSAAGLLAIFLLDQAIIRAGGESFWKDGRFRSL